MYCSVIQLSMNPINEEMTVDDLILVNFVGQVADYVSDEDVEKEETLESFIEYIGPDYVVRDGDTIIFKTGFKKQYFQSRLNQLKQMVAKTTLEQFMNSVYAYDLSTLIEDRFGFYIYDDDYWQTFDDFARDLEEDTIYYIGSVIDYHY